MYHTNKNLRAFHNGLRGKRKQNFKKQIYLIMQRIQFFSSKFDDGISD